jgi:hypothetical protein
MTLYERLGRLRVVFWQFWTWLNMRPLEYQCIHSRTQQYSILEQPSISLIKLVVSITSVWQILVTMSLLATPKYGYKDMGRWTYGSRDCLELGFCDFMMLYSAKALPVTWSHYDSYRDVEYGGITNLRIALYDQRTIQLSAS